MEMRFATGEDLPAFVECHTPPRYADYRLTRLTETTWCIVDTQTGRDGADTLTANGEIQFTPDADGTPGAGVMVGGRNGQGGMGVAVNADRIQRRA